MSRSLVKGCLAGSGVLIAALLAAPPAMAQGARGAAPFGFGRAPSEREVAAWDIDVRPDGHGVRKGNGSVAAGQEIYDAQCGACHGTFGENTSFLAIAGGVRRGDLETGRASVLKESDGLRTLGTKLNHATTLWDYIYRAMPWTNPQSLTVDQVYAVTAYVLYLNGIVSADFTLSDGNILKVAMPNRNGLTSRHGLGRVEDKPDVQGSECMKNCATVATISSEIPEYARNQHGNLAEQQRPMGPTRGIDTTKYGTVASPASAPVVANIGTNSAEDLLARNACAACHGMSTKVVGPSFKEVAERYRGRHDAESYLAMKILQGGQGAWGTIPMPAQASLKPEEAQILVRWILGRTP